MQKLVVIAQNEAKAKEGAEVISNHTKEHGA